MYTTLNTINNVTMLIIEDLVNKLNFVGLIIPPYFSLDKFKVLMLISKTKLLRKEMFGL